MVRGARPENVGLQTRRGILSLAVSGAIAGCLRTQSSNGETTQPTTNTRTEHDGGTTQNGSTATNSTAGISLSAEWGQMGEALGRSLVTANRLYIPTRNNGFMAVSKADGSVLWRGLQEEAEVYSGLFGRQPVDTPEGIVFANYNLVEGNTTGFVFLIDRETGDVRANREIGPVLDRVTYSNGYVIAGPDYNTSDESRPLYGLRLPDLTIEWSIEPTADGGTYLGGVGHDDSAYVGYRKSHETQFLALDPENGESIWEKDYYLLSRPVVSDGSLYFLEGETRMVKVDPETGSLLWERTWPEQNDRTYNFQTSLAVKEGIGVFAVNRQVRAVNLSDGSFKWTVSMPGFAGPEPVIHRGIAWVVPESHPDSSEESSKLLGIEMDSGDTVFEKTMAEPPERVSDLGELLGIEFPSKIIAYSVEGM